MKTVITYVLSTIYLVGGMVVFFTLMEILWRWHLEMKGII